MFGVACVHLLTPLYRQVTRELNLKICDLYQDEELSIIDKVRALLHHIARALRNSPLLLADRQCLHLFV